MEFNKFEKDFGQVLARNITVHSLVASNGGLASVQRLVSLATCRCACNPRCQELRREAVSPWVGFSSIYSPSPASFHSFSFISLSRFVSIASEAHHRASPSRHLCPIPLAQTVALNSSASYFRNCPQPTTTKLSNRHFLHLCLPPSTMAAGTCGQRTSGHLPPS